MEDAEYAIITTGSMSGAETIIQQIDGIEDTKESYVQDILNNGAHLGDETLIRTYVDEDVDAIQWLWDNGLSEYNFSSMRTTGKRSVFAPEHQLYSVARTYKPSANDPTKYKRSEERNHGHGAGGRRLQGCDH